MALLQRRQADVQQRAMSPPTPPPALRLGLHAASHWRRGSGPAHLLERKHAALLAWLWLEGPTPRARLAGLLWPEVGEERARGNLRQRLLKLRQEAGELVRDDNGLLSLAPDVQVDPADPAGAPLLQSQDFSDCDHLARWLDGRREAERERRKREWLAEVREAAQGRRLDDALYAADQLLQTDRESEEAYRVLMEVYYLRGDHAAAISAWDRGRDMLRQLYGVQPSPATQQLGESILAAARSAQAAQLAWAPTPMATRQLPAAVLRPPRLVGRDSALQALQAGWHAGEVLCVAGVAGVGKSRLLGDWASALSRAAAVGTAGQGVVLAAARPGDAVLPYASLSRLLLAVVDRFHPPLDTPDAAQAARVLPRLAALIGPGAQAAPGRLAPPVRTDHERTQALLALGRLLGDCTRRGCLALVLDDLQFADAASLLALRVLAEPGAGTSDHAPAHDRHTPLRFAFGLRPEELGPDAIGLLDSLQATGRCRRVDLAPLSADDAATLLGSLAVPALAAGAWAPQIWRQVGGNPAFLLESVKLLLSTAADQTPASGPLPLPASIEAVIQRRLALLSPRARHLAQLAAIAGSGYSIPLAAAALACAPIELSEPLRELELRQVFYGRQFVHDVIASVAEQSVPATVAEFMHRFVAEHLTQHGADAASIGTHWRACGEWRLAGRAFLQAGRAAGAAALVNEQARLLDQAMAAFEREPAAHGELFTALEERANVFESAGHEGLRPALIERLAQLARTEAQQLSVLNHRNGWLTNLAKPIEEDRIAAGIPRAVAVGRPDLAWYLARMLALHWAMNNRAGDGLALLLQREPWIESQPDPALRAAYRLTRSSIFAFGDQLAEAIAEGQLALAAAKAAEDWPNVLPAMSNVGLMLYWRGAYPASHALLAEARGLRERLYGNSGAGIKIDVHLGAVLYELGEVAQAQHMLQGALTEIASWPDNEYRRTESLLAENHLAQMHIALGQADAAAAVLASDVTGLSDRFVGRRLALRLRWQRVFGGPQAVDAAVVAQLRGIVATLASPFNRLLMALELARLLPAAEAMAEYRRLSTDPAAVQRPGLQLHATALWARAAAQAGEAGEARLALTAAKALSAGCAPFDLPARELAAAMAEAGAGWAQPGPGGLSTSGACAT